jgi:hypothetical protein
MAAIVWCAHEAGQVLPAYAFFSANYFKGEPCDRPKERSLYP